MQRTTRAWAGPGAAAAHRSGAWAAAAAQAAGRYVAAATMIQAAAAHRRAQQGAIAYSTISARRVSAFSRSSYAAAAPVRSFSAASASAPPHSPATATATVEIKHPLPSSSGAGGAPHDLPPALAAPVLSPVETWGTKSARVWGKVKHEAHHYWVGTKLLCAEVRIASRLLRQIAGGHEMTRRERKQLLRTSADLVRMVPFVVILLIPFAEFALPVLLKFFPNMLPSTYLDSTGAEAKLQKQLLVKMEMARFLQETTHLLAQQLAAQHAGQSDTVEAKQSAQQFRDFMSKVRSGKKVLNADIIGFSKLFDSELTLDNLDQKQLEAMCKLLDIKVFGSLWVLRYKLEERLRAIQKDDELIQKDGIDALDDAELQEACRARGIFTGKDSAYLRRKLADWLELSLEHQVPITLLLLSRAFSRQMTGAYDSATGEHEGEGEHGELASDLASTLAYVPEVAVAEAEKEIVDRGDDPAARLKALQEEAVEAAFEELQASKAGLGGDSKTRAAKVRNMKPAVGVTAEKLARLEETNEDVEELIDEIEAETLAEEAAKAAEEAAALQQAADKALARAKDAADKAQAAREAAAALAAAAPAPGSAPATGVAAEAAPAEEPLAAEPLVAEEPVVAAPVVSVSAAPSAEKKKKAKTIAVVDKLNDRIGTIIEEIRIQAEELEKKKLALQQAQQVAAAAAKEQLTEHAEDKTSAKQ